MRLFLLLAACAVFAGAPVGAATSTSYRLAPGDVIEVTVTPQRGFDRTITVQPDGAINYPVAGLVKAAGLTPQQLARKLRAALNRDLIDPEVSVSLKELNKQAVARVSLLGAVRTPSVYEIKEGATVAEVLAAGGGPTALADLRRITVTRADKSVVTVDLGGTTKTGRLERDIALRSGDIVVVPEGALPTVLVMGEVEKPGSIELQGETRLLDVISRAGGPSSRADLSHVTLGRAGQPGPRKLDLQPVVARGDTSNPTLNPVLQPGDTITVHPAAARVYVLGRVARPDLYPLKPNDRILDAVVRAGGSSPDGDLAKTVLVRRDAKGQPVAKTIDLKKMMSGSRTEQNVALQSGDMLYIPDKKERRSGGGLLNTILSVAGLVTLF